jgi:hypothetical protein
VGSSSLGECQDTVLAVQTLVGLLLIGGLTRFRHADLDDLIDRSSRHVAALRRHRAGGGEVEV